MNILIPTFILTLTLVAISIAAISIKSFFIKDGKFNGSCAQNNPLLKNEIGECSLCGKVPEGNCDEPQHSRT